jgi:phage terminase large subunit-like protein
MTLLTVERNDVSVGSQIPRLSLVAKSAFNDYDLAVDLASKYGLDLDEWQQNVLKGWLGQREDEKWTCSLCGLSVPRQNGKGGALEARELYGLLELKERILHTAHELKTAKDHFRRMKSYFENPLYPDLQKLVKRIVNTNGEEAIWLTNGGVIRFAARSKNSGRGFSADLLVCDEAQELSDDEFEALSPVLATSDNPQRILTGTPPAPNMNGEVFTRVRRQGIDGTGERLCWLEWSADKNDPLDAYETWAKANPAFGYRLDIEKTQDEYGIMSDDGFARERLGMWSSTETHSVFDLEAWKSLVSTEVPKGPYMLSVDVSPLRDRASVAVAAYNGDSIQVQIMENRQGTGWVAGFLANTQRDLKPLFTVIDSGSPAGSLITELKAKRVRLLLIGEKDIRQGCGMFLDRVNNGTLLHVNQPALNDAVANARTRPVGDAFAWNKKNVEADITPLVAATNAAHGLTLKRRPKTERDETETRPKPRQRAVIF